MLPSDDVGRADDSAGVDSNDSTVRHRVSPDQSVSEAVVAAVAEAAGVPAAGVPAAGETDALEPLYETVDPDALDALFRRPGDGTSPGTVEFTYGGYAVTVEGRDVVRVTVL